MKIGGNEGIAARLIPMFAVLSLGFASLKLWTLVIEAFPVILDWARHDLLWTGMWISFAGFAICFTLALRP